MAAVFTHYLMEAGMAEGIFDEATAQADAEDRKRGRNNTSEGVAQDQLCTC